MSIKKTYIPAKPRSSKLVGGISGGSGVGSGGMKTSQLEMLTNLADWWKLDEENDAIYSEKSVYSLKGVSALGLGSGGGSGGGGVDMLDAWANYTPDKANYYAPASLLVPFRNDTLSRLTSLEAGGGAIDIDIVTTGTGNAITSLTKSGSVITATKGLSFALASHTHTFASLINKPTTIAGYGITDAVNKSLNLTAGNGLTGGGTLEANRTLTLGTPSTLTNATTNGVTGTSHTHAITTTTVGASNTIVATDASGGVRGNIIRIGGNWTLELSGTELVFKYNGVIKQRMLSNGTILATGGMTALTT